MLRSAFALVFIFTSQKRAKSYKLQSTGEAFVLSDFFIIYAGAYKQFYVGFVFLLREKAKQTLGKVKHLNSVQEKYELRRVFGVT